VTGGRGREGNKEAFFFEKKNQKTFVLKGIRLFQAYAIEPKFLLLFSKRSASLLRAFTQAIPGHPDE
jgi:hypothetical protein